MAQLRPLAPDASGIAKQIQAPDVIDPAVLGDATTQAVGDASTKIATDAFVAAAVAARADESFVYFMS